jgi:predicted O-methyltransferase YrrM
MAEQSLEVGREVASLYDFSRFRSVMDVGGGYGAVLRALLEHHAGLRGTVLDLPMLAERARRYLEEAGVGERAAYQGGDFFAAVPSGADAYVLKFIIHDWDDSKAIPILRNCARAAGAGGVILLIEQIVPDPVTDRDQRVIRGDLTMMTVGGKERTLAEYRELCAAAGLGVARVVAMPSGFSVIETAAEPPRA